MSLPAFLNRVSDAAGPLLGGLGESELGKRLESTSVVLEIAEAAQDPGHRAGFLLAANLAARLYGHLGFDAPQELTDEAVSLARAINPECEVGPPRGGDRTLTLSWCGGDSSAERVTITAESWNLWIDAVEPKTGAAAPPAAMAAAALGIGEMFRVLFADRLIHGRDEPAPFALNILTLSEPADSPPLPDSVELGEVHLAGCGAIGQAAIALLRELPVTGTLFAVDFDPLDEGNLQRYLLSVAADVGTSKPTLIEKALEAHDLAVETVPTRWGADERTAPGRQTVISALDTKQGRIELQAGLHRELFNAWTQPMDIGVSRHQDFGTKACLACLAWPRHPRPSESKLIADSLAEHELRVLHYLASELPVGQRLPAEAIQPSGRLALPEDAIRWAEHSLLEDLIERFGLPREPFESFTSAPIRVLYREAVCGSMLIEHSGTERGPDLSVPLAHQSALAGILLATWLFVDRVPELRDLRPSPTQARYDVLRGGSQIWPRGRQPEPRCICQDADFQAAYAARWGE